MHPILREDEPRIIGSSALLRHCSDYARRVAHLAVPVLITGETGTGKELFARFIHHHSGRPRQGLQIVNCAAIPPALFESEFFGHLKGSFTGALSERQGHFRQADGGTLVLDEIGEMDSQVQVKLLRAIENQEIFPVGAPKAVHVNARIIALTNRNLPLEIAGGRFREDLFHRLNTLHIVLPPLRERPQDIALLARLLLTNLQRKGHCDRPVALRPEALEVLQGLPYPGNVRDLQNLLIKLLAHLPPEKNSISRADLQRHGIGIGMPLPDNTGPESLNGYLQRMEKQRIRQVLQECDCNITHAATQLGLSRQALQYRLRRLGIAPGQLW